MVEILKRDLDLDTSFLDSLSVEHLGLLRNAVKKIHMMYYPEHLYSDEMADMLICKFGNEYCEKLLKKLVDSGMN